LGFTKTDLQISVKTYPGYPSCENRFGQIIFPNRTARITSQTAGGDDAIHAARLTVKNAGNAKKIFQPETGKLFERRFVPAIYLMHSL